MGIIIVQAQKSQCDQTGDRGSRWRAGMRQDGEGRRGVYVFDIKVNALTAAAVLSDVWGERRGQEKEEGCV